MHDRIGGDTEGFRTVKRMTPDGVATLRTKGTSRSQITFEPNKTDEVVIDEALLVEIDLANQKTQNDRLYYHDKDEDENAEEFRLWSTDGLLSLVIKPLRRIIFKTQRMVPRIKFSVWLGDEDKDGVVSEPDVDEAADTNVALVEVVSSREYHPEVYVYPRNDDFSDYSKLLGVGFALQRLKQIELSTDIEDDDAPTHMVTFRGFDADGNLVEFPEDIGAATCLNLIEKKFKKRTHNVGDDDAERIKSFMLYRDKNLSFKVKLAENGGLLPFADMAGVFMANEYSGNADDIRKIGDLCRVNAFGQPWHGFLHVNRITGAATIYADHTKSTVLCGGISMPTGQYIPHRQYSVGDYDLQIPGTAGAALRQRIVMPCGMHSPGAGRALSLDEVLYKDANGVVTVIRVDTVPSSFNMSTLRKLTLKVVLKNRYDNFLDNDGPLINSELASHQTPTAVLYPLVLPSIVVDVSEDAKHILVAAREHRTYDDLITHWSVDFSGNYSEDESGNYNGDIAAAISFEPCGQEQTSYWLYSEDRETWSQDYEHYIPPIYPVYNESETSFPNGHIGPTTGNQGTTTIVTRSNTYNDDGAFPYTYWSRGYAGIALSFCYEDGAWVLLQFVTVREIERTSSRTLTSASGTATFVRDGDGNPVSVTYDDNIYGVSYEYTTTVSLRYGIIRGKIGDIDSLQLIGPRGSLTTRDITERMLFNSYHQVNEVITGEFTGAWGITYFPEDVLSVDPLFSSGNGYAPMSDIRFRAVTIKALSAHHEQLDERTAWVANGVISEAIPYPLPSGKHLAYNSLNKQIHMIDADGYGIFI